MIMDTPELLMRGGRCERLVVHNMTMDVRK